MSNYSLSQCKLFILFLYLIIMLRSCLQCIQPVKTERWGAGVVICLQRGADLHVAQLMPLPLTVSCFSKIQIGFTFLVPAHPGSPRQRAVKWLCACVCVLFCSNKTTFKFQCTKQPKTARLKSIIS